MTLPELPRDMPAPEPKEVDEKLQLDLHHLASDAGLKGHPVRDERCKNCLYYLEPDKSLSYCWHMKLRILVDDDWWCHWWQAHEE